MDPLLKWAGGKRWQLPIVAPIWQKHKTRRFVEPFAGGLAMTLGLCPNKALICDINPHLINLYRQLKHGLPRRWVMTNTEDYYYAARKSFNDRIAFGNELTPDSAELFYYLNRTCFNGLCRFNQSGFFNVPYGKYKTVTYRDSFDDFHKVFRNYDVMRAEGFDTCIPDLVDRGDFIYADPPYDDGFTNYSKDGFQWKDQKCLAELLAIHDGPVIATNKATERIMKLYRGLGFQVEGIHAPRRISCTGDRTPVMEMFATRNL